MDNLNKNKARIINISSSASNYGKLHFDLFKMDGKSETVQNLYRQSKLCNVLFTNELAKRYGNKITTYAVDPGLVNTNISHHVSYRPIVKRVMWWIAKTPIQGSQTAIFAVLCDKNDVPNGSFLKECAVTENTNPLTKDLALQKKLWETSEDFVSVYK